jgi:hypothetical protein
MLTAELATYRVISTNSGATVHHSVVSLCCTVYSELLIAEISEPPFLLLTRLLIKRLNVVFTWG